MKISNEIKALEGKYNAAVSNGLRIKASRINNILNELEQRLSRRTVEIKVVLPYHFYDHEDRLTQAGYEAVQKLIELNDLEFIAINH